LLGNLTLLEKPINASIGQDFFALKRVEYQKSGLFMTKSLAESQSVGVKTSFGRAAKLLSQHTVWSSDAIRIRQQEFAKLAIGMWGFSLKSQSKAAPC
jgi:hypothetical protein